MTIEKLQKVATAHVDSHFKAKWLRWWNSPPDVKNKKRFPLDLPLREKVLDIWLNKASFWAQLKKGVEGEIASFENECSVEIDWSSVEDVYQPANYVEHWRLNLWDKAFLVYFDDKGDFKFMKGLDLMDFKEGPIAIKRVAYRFIHRELVVKNALPSSCLPTFLVDWVDVNSDLCVYKPVQVSKFSESHLQVGGWYLDCSGGFVPEEEKPLFSSLIPCIHRGVSNTWTLKPFWVSSLQLSSSSFPGRRANVSVFKSMKERPFGDASILLHGSALCNLASYEDLSRTEHLWKTSRKPADSSSVDFFVQMH